MNKEEMIYNHLMARGIKDERVLAAMKKIPREAFVPEQFIECAYEDGPLPIGEDQTISQPYIVALMTQLLELNGSEKVLEVGAGSGYQTAVLAELAGKVYSLEIIETLAQKAKSALYNLGYKNVKVKTANGYTGWLEFAPFDAIIVTCAPANIPRQLVDQLADGGRMVIPVGIKEFGQRLLRIKKHKGKITKEDHGGVLFVPMVDK